VHIGQTVCSIETRVKEHHRYIHLCHPKKSLLAEHSIYLGYCIQLHNTSILAKKLRLMDQVIREVVEIEIHPSNINRDDDFFLSRLWKSHLWPEGTETCTQQEHDALRWALKRADSSFTSFPAQPPLCNLLEDSLLSQILFPIFLFSDWPLSLSLPSSNPI
jgi:hypothetical protein